MDKGYIKRMENGYSQPKFEIKLVDNTVKMTVPQIAELFDVYINTINNNLRALFKSNILRQSDIMTECKYTNKKGQLCIYEEYNLDAVIALAYRIDSYSMRSFREYIVSAFCLKSNQQNKLTCLLPVNICWN
jgi:hypothetical protein